MTIPVFYFESTKNNPVCTCGKCYPHFHDEEEDILAKFRKITDDLND